MDIYMTTQRRSRMTYNIPKKIKIGGQTFKVIVKKTIEREDAIGEFRSLMNEIHVQTHIEGKKIPVSQVQQTFCHEFIHCLFDACRQEDLNRNEELVDLMGDFLHQALGDRIFSD